MKKLRTTAVLVTGACAGAIALAAALWPHDHHLQQTPQRVQVNNDAAQVTAKPTEKAQAALVDTNYPQEQSASIRDAAAEHREPASVGSDSVREKHADSVAAQHSRRDSLKSNAELFFENQSGWSEQQRHERALELEKEIAWATDNEFLLPIESTQLRIGLINAIYENPLDRQQRIQKLLQGHKNESTTTRRNIATDPRHIQYKSREAKIVSEIMQSPDFASNEERQVAIRSRLVSLRQEVYADNTKR